MGRRELSVLADVSILLSQIPSGNSPKLHCFQSLPRLTIEFAILAMKRCPECHFTFEDREQVCDFDGSELVAFDDPAPLSDRIASPSRKSRLIRLTKSRPALIVLVGLLLMSSVLLIVRYKSSSPPKPVERVTTERRDSIVRAAPARKSRRRIAHVHKPERRRRITIAKAATHRRISTARTTARQRSAPTYFSKQTVARSEKKDSKLNVVFKKTGNALKKTFNILKKPFDL